MTALLREVIGDVLRRSRVEQGRTLREVSDAARVSLGYLSEVERGRKEASSELLSAICGALEVPLSRVLSEAGDGLALDEGPRRDGGGRGSGGHYRHRRLHQGSHSAGRVDGGGLTGWPDHPSPLLRRDCSAIMRNAHGCTQGVVICAEPISWVKGTSRHSQTVRHTCRDPTPKQR